MTKKIAILAANFAGNKGAAAMLKSIVKNLDTEYEEASYNLLSVYPKSDRKENTFENLKVVSCKPHEIIFIGFGLAVLYYILRWFWPAKKILLKYKILKALYQADIVIDAAGISFVDSRGFIMNTYNFICVATPILLGKTVIKYSQALGPFNTFWNRTLAKIVLPRLYRICARGKITESHLNTLKLKNITLCADGAFSLPDDPEAKKRVKTIIKDDNFYDKKIVSISLSSVVDKYCTRIGIDYRNIMSSFIDYLIKEKNYGVLIIANSARKGTMKSHNNDLIVCQSIFDRVENKEGCRWYPDIFTPEELRVFTGFSYLMVASRFHAMIGALHKNVPVFLVGWSHKYKEILDMFSLGENAIDYRQLSLDKLIIEFNLFEQKREEIYKKIKENLPDIEKNSKKNFEIIKKALEENKNSYGKGVLDYNNPEKYIGNFKKMYIGYANNKDIREGAGSGGIISSILIYLLKKGEIDGALVSKQTMIDGKIGVKTFIARNAEEILDCRTSIYMDFPIKKHLKDMLEFKGRIAIVALPCFLKTLKKLEKENAGLKEKIPYRISLFCSGNNTGKLIKKILSKNRIKLPEVERIIFRKGHWRGMTHLLMKDGSEKIISYMHNIGTYRNLYYYSLPKCFSCQDHFGFYSDISCGDFWLSEMKNNPIKHTSIITRNEKTDNLLNEMAHNNIIKLQAVSAREILKSQKRALVFKFNSAYARKRVGRFFGFECTAADLEKSKWNHYIAAFLIALNMKLYKSKLIDFIPNKLLFVYMCFLRSLISF